MEFDSKHCKFKHPANILMVGMTGSGKTILIRRIIKNFKDLFHNINKDKIKVLWAYGQWHNLIDLKINDNVDVIYVEGIPDEDQILEHNPDIIIIDDLLSEIKKNKTFENLFIKKSHHLNISIIFSVQNLFYNSDNMRTISLNCHYIILMKNPRDKNQIKHLARQIYPSNMSFLTEVYNRATLHPFGYIRIDVSPDTPEKIRLQSRITPEEITHLNTNLAPIVYIDPNVKEFE